MRVTTERRQQMLEYLCEAESVNKNTNGTQANRINHKM